MQIVIEKNVILANHTTFKIGGPAKEFAVVKSEQEFIEALKYARKNSLKYYVLGGGSNVLFDDRGFDGLVIKIVPTLSYQIQDAEIECWAGENLGNVVNFAKENNLSGMENLIGIPGTVGGAIRGNAGAFGVDIASMTKTVRFCDVSNFEIKVFSSYDCGFGYRNSKFKENSNLVVLSVMLCLRHGNKEEIMQKMTEIIGKRVEKQPRGWYGSAGSFFMNPVVSNLKMIEQFEKGTGMKMKDNKLPAGWVIAEAGFLGRKIGGVQISEKHANFVINNGNGTAEEVMMLVSIIKQKVRTEMGIQLQEEVQFVGF